MDITENLAINERPIMAIVPAFDQKVVDLMPLERKGFILEDILWAVGIWSVLLTMTPVILFYMLMVA